MLEELERNRFVSYFPRSLDAMNSCLKAGSKGFISPEEVRRVQIQEIRGCFLLARYQ